MGRGYWFVVFEDSQQGYRWHRRGPVSLCCKWWRISKVRSGTCHEEYMLTSISNWKWPDIPGIDSYKGILLHSAHWDQGAELTGKKIAVIGNGSSGIQLVTALQTGKLHRAKYYHNANKRKLLETSRRSSGVLPGSRQL